MATRNYRNEAVDIAAKESAINAGPDSWQKREARQLGLQLAKDLSEVGSDAADVVADAKTFADFLLTD